MNNIVVIKQSSGIVSMDVLGIEIKFLKQDFEEECFGAEKF
jgi:hypothetical protein